MKYFGPATSDTKVEAISLYGSSVVGNFAVLEYQNSFKLKRDMPEAAAHFGSLTKAGDTIVLIGVSIIYWNEEGKVKRHMEHARLKWDGFDLNSVKRM